MRRPPPPSIPLIAAAAIAAILIASPPVAHAAELRVAVLEFDNAGPAEFDGLGKGLQSMITTDLTNVSALRLVERARLNDILAEQKLGRSGAVDPKTASRIGALAGASHLLSGSYTVVGGKMRLDTRLFAVRSGEVLLAEKIEGDKDAFFELEKALVQKLIASVGVAVQPRERAAVGRVHTADFEAFRSFSLGVKLYDDKQYDQSLAALREATRRDADFKLAALTLDEYQRLITQLQTRADDLLTAQRGLEAAKRDKEARAQAELIEKLWAVAGRADSPATKTGKATNAISPAREQRLAALYNLAVILANIGRNQGKIHRLRAIEDRFALARAADAAAKRYFADAQSLFPKTLPLTFDDDFYNPGFLEHPEDFEKQLADAVRRLFQKGELDENRKNRQVSATRYVDPTARMLWLDHRQSVALHDQLYQGALQLDPGDHHRTSEREALAKQWREALDLDKSTAYLTELTRGVDNPYRMQGLVKSVEANRDLSVLLAASPTPELLREYVLLSKCGGQCSAKQLFGTDRTPSRRAFEALARHRALDAGEYVWIGDQPMWPLQSQFHLWTGPRSDMRRARDLRYFRARDNNDPDALVIVGGAPRRDLTARMRLRYAVPTDFTARGVDEVTGRPEVSVLFGATDLDCAKQRDPQTQKDVMVRPMKTFAVVFAPDRIRLVELVESEHGMWDRKQAFAEREIASERADLAGDSIDVTIEQRGPALTVTAGGRRAAFKLPAPPDGFAGLRLRGLGFVAVEDPRFAPPAR